jgi:hypothetical protein
VVKYVTDTATVVGLSEEIEGYITCDDSEMIPRSSGQKTLQCQPTSSGTVKVISRTNIRID